MSEDAALELAAQQLSDAQQLRRALDQLVISCRAVLTGEMRAAELEPAVLFGEGALEDTSHQGWMRKMAKRYAAVMAERFNDCRRNGRHLEIVWSSGEPPRCTHCERLVNTDTPEGF